MVIVSGMKVVQLDRTAAYSYLFKVCLVGSAKVGKTSTLIRFTEGNFTGQHITTTGMDFAVQSVEMANGQLIKLQLWDTAGEEKFRTITTSYYRGSSGIVVFFDLTNMDSFKNVLPWIHEVRRYANEDVVIVIAGTKSDLIDERVVSSEEASELAEEQGLKYIEISAKTADNMLELFETLVLNMIELKEQYSQTRQVLAMRGTVKPFGKKNQKSNSNKSSSSSNTKSKTCTIL